MDRLEIKPKSKRNAVLVAIGCGIFALVGVAMMLDGDGSDALVGMLCLLFFGIGGVIAIPKLFRRTISVVLTKQGIEQKHIYGNALIRWSDIEEIGITKMFGQQMVGVRISNYDRYLADMSPKFASALTKSLPYFKLLALFMPFANIPLAVRLWSRLENSADPIRSLKDFGKVGDLAGLMMWQRKTFGYEILFGWADIDRPYAEFVELLNNYRLATEQDT
jgi:hypothetical protein